MKEEIRKSVIDIIGDIPWNNHFITLLDEKGNILYMTRSLEKILGYKPDELVGRNIFDLIASDDYPDIMENIIELFQTDSYVHREFRVKHKDGSWRDLEIVAKNFLDNSEVRTIIINSHDISEQKKLEAVIKEFNERLEFALWTANEGIWDWNLQTGRIYLSSHCVNMLGYSDGEIEGDITLLEKLIHPDDLLKLQQTLNEHLQGEIPYYETEFRLKTKSDDWNWVIGRGRVVQRDKEGKPLRIMGMQRDIMDKKIIEQAFHESEGKLRVIFNSINDIVVLIDVMGTILALNDALAKKLNKKIGELLGTSFFDYLPPDVAKERKERIDEVINSGKSVRFEDEYEGESFDNTIYPIFDSTGKVVSLAIYSHDITKYKEAEKLLLESENRYRLLFNSVYDCIFVHEIKEDGMPGEIIEINDTACQLLGYTKAEFLNLSFSDIIAPEIKRTSPARTQKIIKEKHALFDSILLAKDGKKIDFEVHAHSFELNGKPTILSIARDITERKILEKQFLQAQKMESIGTLAGGIAHDFNNILTAIIGSVDMLSMLTKDNEELSLYVSLIEQASKRGADLAKYLLKFARLEIYQMKSILINQYLRHF